MVFATARAAEVSVAVASNFLRPAQALVARFEALSGHQVTLSSGSTGKLYAQIRHGAPFDVFLAANAREPMRLERDGLAVHGTRFTYALGRLALWAGGKPVDADSARDSICGEGRLAIANPKTAPYGAAAIEVLRHLGCEDAAAARFVRGENIAQTYQFVASGNVPFGLVSASQVHDSDDREHWSIPESWHAPIEQQAVLLERAEGNPAASEFIAWLRGDEARTTIRRSGYGVTD